MSEYQQNGLWGIVAKIKPKIKHVRASGVVLTEIWLKKKGYRSGLCLPTFVTLSIKLAHAARSLVTDQLVQTGIKMDFEYPGC
jgi:hypothetical protein